MTTVNIYINWVSMKILIKNGRIIDKYTDTYSDLLLENEIIKKIDKNIEEVVDKVIDAKGLIVMPGFVDTHAHFRDPGYTYKEDLESGSNAAINGGYTFVNIMANTKPVCDNMEVFNDIKNRAANIDICGINQTMSLTKSLMGKEFINFESLDDNINILSDDGKDLLSNDMMYKACKICAKKDKTIMVHAEDSDISPYDYRVAEDLITIRDVYLSGKTGCHIHMSHVSTKDAIYAIREAKKNNYNVTCEVTPHHISLHDLDYRVNPPIREKKDVEAMIEAIKDGTVDTIGTDHAPHSKEDKEKGSPGMVGIETSFSVCNTYLVKSGHIDYKKLSDIMSYGGSKILRLKKRGLIRENFYADIVIVDADKKIIVDVDKFKSKSNNTPFEGMELFGEIRMTIRNGRVVKDDNR